MTGQDRQQQIEARQATVKAALDLGLQAWRITSSRRLFTEAHEALDDLVRDAARLSGLQDTLAKLDKATTALRMIEENEHGESWSAGVAMSALSAMEEVGYPKPHPRPDLFGPYTMGVKLCDDDGIVRSGRFHSGTDYPCTGHAHFAGEHIECTSPAHRAALAPNTDGPDDA